MPKLTDETRLNIALLNIIAVSQIIHDTGDLTDPVALEYADAVRGFRDYTMECLARMRPPSLRSVD